MSGGPMPNFARTPGASRIVLGRPSIWPRAYLARIVPDPCQAFRWRLFARSRGRTRDGQLKRAHHQLPARSSAKRRCPWPRAPPRIDGTARAVRARCRHRSCSPPKGDREMIRSRGGDTEIGVAGLDHLEHSLQHADDSAVRAVTPLLNRRNPYKRRKSS